MDEPSEDTDGTKEIIESLWEGLKSDSDPDSTVDPLSPSKAEPEPIPLVPQAQILHDLYTSPVEKHVAIMEQMEQIPPDTLNKLLDVDTWKSKRPGHQTVIVFETSESSNGKFRERASRLAASLNTIETIKADYLSLSDGVWYEGLVFEGSTPGGLPKAYIEQQARDWGYNQCVVVSYCGS